jgi:hypothetical protein
MSERKPTDRCLLCCEKEATKTNSHIVPACLLVSMIGKRDKEYSISIKASEAKIDEYYGRANLENQSTEIKKHHQAEDFYFCPECEKRLGLLEGKVCPMVTNQLRDPKYSSNFKIFTTQDGVSITELFKISPDDFSVFFLSVLWRQTLQHQVNYNETSALSETEMETIRRLVHSYLYEDDTYKKICDQFWLIIMTSDLLEDASMNIVEVLHSNESPKMFLMNEFWVLLYSAKDFDECKKLIEPSQYFRFPPIPDWLNYPPNPPRMILLPKETWNSLLKTNFQIMANIFNKS